MRHHLPLSPIRHVEVFAVEVDAAQVSWRNLAPGPVRVSCADTELTVEYHGDSAVVALDNLPPNSHLTVEVRAADDSLFRLPIVTLAPPPGELLARFASLSDLHLGSTKFGLIFKRSENPEPDVPHPMRCAIAARTEALAWGAEQLVLKGDLTHHTGAEEWPQLAEFLHGLTVPHLLTLGNHDRQPKKKGIDTDKGLANSGIGFRPVDSVDLPGIRLVVADTSVQDRGYGRVHAIRDEVVDLLAQTNGPTFLGLHHHLEGLPFPWFWPPGIPFAQGRHFLETVKAANPRLLISSGHTHRNRAYRRRGVLITEVGSPKDYPGVWAGYSVYEGGITQTIRRVCEPSALAWTDPTRKAVGGIWGMWAPGHIDQRCISHTWT